MRSQRRRPARHAPGGCRGEGVTQRLVKEATWRRKGPDAHSSAFVLQLQGCMGRRGYHTPPPTRPYNPLFCRQALACLVLGDPLTSPRVLPDAAPACATEAAAGRAKSGTGRWIACSTQETIVMAALCASVLLGPLASPAFVAKLPRNASLTLSVVYLVSSISRTWLPLPNILAWCVSLLQALPCCP